MPPLELKIFSETPDGAGVRSAISGFVQVIHFERMAGETTQAKVVISLFSVPGSLSDRERPSRTSCQRSASKP